MERKEINSLLLKLFENVKTIKQLYKADFPVSN